MGQMFLIELRGGAKVYFPLRKLQLQYAEMSSQSFSKEKVPRKDCRGEEERMKRRREE